MSLETRQAIESFCRTVQRPIVLDTPPFCFVKTTSALHESAMSEYVIHLLARQLLHEKLCLVRFYLSLPKSNFDVSRYGYPLPPYNLTHGNLPILTQSNVPANCTKELFFSERTIIGDECSAVLRQVTIGSLACNYGPSRNIGVPCRPFKAADCLRLKTSVCVGVFLALLSLEFELCLLGEYRVDNFRRVLCLVLKPGVLVPEFPVVLPFCRGGSLVSTE